MKIVDNFKSITWPKKARVKKEFIITAIGTIVIAVACVGIDALAQLIIKLFV